MEQIAAAKEELKDPNESFKLNLEAIAVDIPEIAERSEAIEVAGAELIEEFGIGHEFFDDKAHTLFFSAIADRYAKLEADKDNLGHGKYSSEKEFIFDSTILLTLKNSRLYEDLKPQISGNEVEGPAKKEIYDKFTNDQVSKELGDAINSGLLDRVKKKLGVNTENEDQYGIRVLNIGDEDSTFGMTPPMSPTLDKKPMNGPEWKAHFESQEDFKKYLEHLEENQKEFAEALGRESIPLAWVTEIDGVKQLCMPLPVVEKILYKDQPRSNYYDVNYQEDDFAKLTHEYTHTQGGLNLDRDLFFGMGLEERRAELFSGDHMGYQDIKGFYNDVRLITGVSIVELMEAREKGGDPYELFKTLATELGVDATLELALTAPNTYIATAEPIQKQVSQHIGGYNKLSQRLYQKQVENGKTEETESRIEASVDNIIAKDIDIEFVFNYRKSAYGLDFMTDKMQVIHDRKMKELAAA